MKTLSLLQPWATLVVMGAKKIETRNWATAYQGSLLIHASQGRAGEIFCREFPFKKYIPDFSRLPFGAIIGSVTLTSCIRITELGLNDEKLNRLTLEEKAFGDYSAGRVAWILENPTAFDKITPARGSLHLWDYDAPLLSFAD